MFKLGRPETIPHKAIVQKAYPKAKCRYHNTAIGGGYIVELNDGSKRSWAGWVAWKAWERACDGLALSEEILTGGNNGKV